MAKNKKPKSNTILIILLVTAVLVGAGSIAGITIHKKMTDPFIAYKITYTESLVTNASTRYLPYEGGYVRVSHDGAEAVNSDGLRLWNVSYDMNNPVADVCGSYAVIGDLKGRLVYIMDGTGAVHKVEMPYEICEVECSEVGVAAVRMYEDGADYIRLVDVNAEVLVEIKTIEDKDGFPVDMDLSSDGKKLVTSYLVIEGDEAGGWITFYNFGSVGKNYANNVTGVFKYEKVIPNLKFINSSSLCAFSEEGIKFYSVPETPSLSKEVSYENKVISVVTGDGLVAVLESYTKDGLLSQTRAYDSKGNLYFESRTSNELKGIMFFGKDLLFYNEYACQILSKDNIVRYNGNFDEHKIEKLVSVNGKDKILLFEDGQVLTIQLTKSGVTE